MTRRQSNRRVFLQQAAGALAAPLVLPAGALGRAASTVAPSNRLTMALIGCGGMGNANVNGFLRKAETQVVAVCDVDRDRRLSSKQGIEKFYAERDGAGSYHGCDDYNDFRDVLARDDIDAVIVATPDHWHGYVNVLAAESGKDIYGEKPLSVTIQEGRLMSDTMRRLGRVFQTGSQQRSDNRFRFACELVRNGRIGKIHQIEVGIPSGSRTGNHPAIPVPDGFDYDLWLGPAPWAPYCENRTHYNFRHILDYSGGKLCDWGAHHIDIAQWGLDMLESGPVALEGTGEYPDDGLWTAAVNFDFTATYESGTLLHVCNKFPQGVKFIGEDGWIFVRRGFIDASPKRLLQEKIGPEEINLYPSGDHRQNFLDCVRSRGVTAAPIEHAHRTISIAHLANIAMQLGRKIQWDPAREQIVGDIIANRLLGRAAREPWRLS
jgi:predicted dehydrogenase